MRCVEHIICNVEERNAYRRHRREDTAKKAYTYMGEY
jgi:hypothetical protein